VTVRLGNLNVAVATLDDPEEVRVAGDAKNGEPSEG
jgi:hypothetical protein